MAVDFDSRDLTPEAKQLVMASGLLDNKFDDVIATLARRGIAQRADDTLTKEPKPKKNRYGNVAQPTRYKGVRYDSKAEAEYAAWLDWRIGSSNPIAWWLRQIFIPLGPDFGTRVDFLVAIGGFHYQGYPQSMLRTIEAHEVKGKETREFAKVRKLWPKYAPFPLHIIKRGNVEIINGA